MTDETETPDRDKSEQPGQAEKPREYTDPVVKRLDDAVRAGQEAQKKNISSLGEAAKRMQADQAKAMQGLAGVGAQHQEAMKKAHATQMKNLAGLQGAAAGFKGVAAMQGVSGLKGIGKQYEETLRKARTGLGMSLRQVSGITGVSPATLSQLETGVRANVRPSTAAKLELFLQNVEDVERGESFEGGEHAEGAAGVEGFALRQVDNLLRDAGLSERARRHVRETTMLWFKLEKDGDEA